MIIAMHILIVLKRTITATGTDDVNRINKKLAFKNNASFISCISKINNTITGNADDLDIA